MNRKLILVAPIAVLVFALFVPVVYRSEHDECNVKDGVPDDCTHVTITQSISYQFIGFGGILSYPIGYKVDNCACFGIRVP